MTITRPASQKFPWLWTWSSAIIDPMETIGRYRVVSLIGGGGMATVYKAEHPVLGETVAIKVLHPHLAADPGFLTRFRQEAKAVAHLRHPNIVRWLDFDADGDTCFMVLEYIDGPTLEAHLLGLAAQGKKLSPTEVLALLRPLAAALDYAHAKGFVHRDMKPANILLTSAGEPVITDFGIARFLDQTGITLTGTVLGSAYYMSPEQIEGRPTDGRSDLYSLGVILFQTLTGQVPFDGESTAVILAKHLMQPVPAAHGLDPSLPPEIDLVLQRVLAKDREERYGSGTELLHDFEKALLGSTVIAQLSPVTQVELKPGPHPEEGPVTSVPPAPPSSKTSDSSPQGWVRNRRRGLLIALVVLAVILAVPIGLLVASASNADRVTTTDSTASVAVSTDFSTTTGSSTTTTTALATTYTNDGVMQSYGVGDLGPAGGLIFYDKGHDSEGWRYLEAAPASTEWEAAPWGSGGTDIPGAQGTAVGTGKQNTADLIAAQGTGIIYAAQLCEALTYGGYGDWFLPSRDELDLVYTNLKCRDLGGFRPDDYWSSSEHAARSAWYQYFGGGYQSVNYFKDGSTRVRAVRAFSRTGTTSTTVPSTTTSRPFATTGRPSTTSTRPPASTTTPPTTTTEPPTTTTSEPVPPPQTTVTRKPPAPPSTVIVH